MNTSAGTAAATRIGEILLLFADGPEVRGVTDISRELGLPKAVAHRALHSLVEVGLLATDAPTRGYRLGPGMASLGARALRDSDLRSAAMPELFRLQCMTGETATVSARIGRLRAYLDQVPSDQAIHMTVEVGTRFPLHAGGSGKAILAYLPPNMIEEILAAGLETLTPNTVTDPAKLRQECQRIRELGYAISVGERESDACSVGAPVLGLDGTPVGSISLCGPAVRMGSAELEEMAPHLVEASQRVSVAMGYQSDGPQRKGPKK